MPRFLCGDWHRIFKSKHTKFALYRGKEKREMQCVVFVGKETPKLVICRSSRVCFLLTSAQELLTSSLKNLLPRSWSSSASFRHFTPLEARWMRAKCYSLNSVTLQAELFYGYKIITFMSVDLKDLTIWKTLLL